MNKNKVFLVIGGDLRQIYLAEELSRFYKVYIAGFGGNMISSKRIIHLNSLMSLDEQVDGIILPIPASQDDTTVNAPFYNKSIPLRLLIPLINDSGILFGGNFSDKTKSIFKENKIEYVDYLKREELSVLNAVPTAEGAVQIAMEELPTTIFGEKILITGMGRISKALIKILTAMGAEVYASARKYSDLAWAEIFGAKPVHISKLKEKLSEFNLIMNTIPSVIFDREALAQINTDCLLIDLSSKPGGVDFDIASEMGIKTIWALSLPGKVAPASSGKIIAGTILNILRERSEPNG